MTESPIVDSKYETLYTDFKNHPVNERSSTNFYGGEKELEQARRNAVQIAARTIATEFFLNNRHKSEYIVLMKNGLDNSDNKDRFIEASNAIALAMIITDKEKLKAKLREQELDYFPDTYFSEVFEQLSKTADLIK